TQVGLRKFAAYVPTPEEFRAMSPQQRSVALWETGMALRWLNLAHQAHNGIKQPDPGRSSILETQTKNILSRAEGIVKIQPDNEVSRLRAEVKRTINEKTVLKSVKPILDISSTANYERPKMSTSSNQPPAPANSSASTPQTKPGPPPTPSANPQNQSSKTNPGDSLYICMYAGWVISKGPCRAPSEIPQDSQIKSFDEKFKCTQPPLMCNPLLFGFEGQCPGLNAQELKVDKSCFAKAKPICIPRSPTATKDCADITNSAESLDKAAAVILAHPDAWEKYRKSFSDLCDDKKINYNQFVSDGQGARKGKPKEVIVKDIEWTCAQANRRLSELRARWGDRLGGVKTNAPSAPARPVEPASRGRR
ncbi:MAG: hypothetical protein N2578_09770, partial [Bdellovibrionaceae bacterium]|nr:hypothetical protein [Pseudobdellovibrionaceae bacterium]